MLWIKWKLRAAALLISCSMLLSATSRGALVRATSANFPGFSLSPQVLGWLGEVRQRLADRIFFEYAELDEPGANGDFNFGISYLAAGGIAVIRVDRSFLKRPKGQVETVIGHELLHLRLRVRGYPQFLLAKSLKNRSGGSAQDSEQEHVNDIVSLIEHRIFAREMAATGFNRLIDLTNGLDAARARKGKADGYADAINYARALLEWDDPAKLSQMTQVYRDNGWTTSLDRGSRAAEIIRSASIGAPADVTPVFLACMKAIYGYDFTLESDPQDETGAYYPTYLLHLYRN